MEQADLTPLRRLTEDDVIRALDGAYVTLPLTDPAAVVEAVQRIVDLLYGEIET